jgi:hypothetical protein
MIAQDIRERSEIRYMKNVRRPLMLLRQAHLLEINKQSPYKQIKIMDKNSKENYKKETEEIANYASKDTHK